MPKFLPPDEVEALREKGVDFPPVAPAIPSETVARALGDIGLPHSEKVERLEIEASEEPEFIGSLESISNHTLRNRYRTAYDATKYIMSLSDESLPNLEDVDLLTQLKRLKPGFEVLQSKGLGPEVILTPANRSVDFWINLYKAVQDSPLNPDHARGYGKVLHHGGLFVADELKKNWASLTNSESDHPWKLSVISALPKSKLDLITGYGYTDSTNQIPSHELNQVLNHLGQPLVQTRTVYQPTQPNIHPSSDDYLMHQLTRITQNKEPLDSSAYSWLNGILPERNVPAGTWHSSFGRITLDHFLDDFVSSNIGIRLSVRANHA